jgi:hypothetical protein
MDFYNETNFIGELWSRDADNNIFSVNQSLSSIFRKYKDSNVTFYNELTSNNIKKFDLFYDSFFIQTQTGYIFEKYVTDNNNIEPFDKINNFSSNKTDYNVDYWFDEINKNVYLFEFFPTSYIEPRQNLNAIQFSFIFKCFDTKTNIIKDLLKENVIFWIENPENLNSNGVLEHPKLTYNNDTNTFNVSFIVKNDISKTGMVSMNFKEKQIIKIDTFIPYGTVKPYIEPSPTPQATNIPPSQTPSITPTLTPTITQTTTSNKPTPSVTSTITSTPTLTPPPSFTPTPTPTNVAVKSVYIAFN